MRLLFVLLLAVAPVFTISDSVLARSFWTDANGDGLPDQGGPGAMVAVGDTVLVDLWIDSGDLVWEDCFLYLGWPPPCFRFTNVGFYLEGEANLWRLVSPDTLGFVGFGYSESGVDRIGWIKLRCDQAGPCCVEPLTADRQPFEPTSHLDAGDESYLFSDRDVSCFNSNVPNATEPRSWGQMKALYR